MNPAFSDLFHKPVQPVRVIQEIIVRNIDILRFDLRDLVHHIVDIAAA